MNAASDSSLYQASVPVFMRMMKNLVQILEKGQAHAEAKKIDPAVLLGSRLFPDMFALTRQVQIVTDSAKGIARLAGVEVPVYEDKESTFEELIERLHRTCSFLETLSPQQFVGAEERIVTLPTRNGPLSFSGKQYVQGFAVPNFFFHTVTAYNILRHNGVELGKKDFLGAM